MEISQTDYEILKACRRQLQNFLLLGLLTEAYTKQRIYIIAMRQGIIMHC